MYHQNNPNVLIMMVNLRAKRVNKGALIDQGLFQQQGPLFMGNIGQGMIKDLDI